MPSTRIVVTVVALLAIVVSGIALAQTAAGEHPTRPDHMPPATSSGQRSMDPDPVREMMQRHQGTMPITGSPAGMHEASTEPTMAGQDAFGAIQEIVRILDDDPKTDWSKVDLEALRPHLIDMNEVALKADERPKAIDGGLQIAVTGSGRTLLAIQRMVPEWARMANALNGWSAEATPLPNGELLTVTAKTPKEIAYIRGLGFIGLLASGSWHQPHHLMMARGESLPMH
jgi:hypothetical protein